MQDFPVTYTHHDGTKFFDVTDFFKNEAAKSGVETGFVLIENNSPASAILIQEARQYVEKDMLERISKYAKPGDLESIFVAYQALPVRNGELVLGKWQSLLVMAAKVVENLSLPAEFIPGTLQTVTIDTGKCGNPVYERNKSDYINRGSERIFDITDTIARNARVMNDNFTEDAAVYAGTGNTTCVLYNDIKGEGVESLVKRLDDFAPPNLPLSAYAHNDLEGRRKRSEIPPDERQNGRSHVLCGLMLQASIIFPASGPTGKIYLVELDGPRKNRLLHIGVAEKHSYQALMGSTVE